MDGFLTIMGVTSYIAYMHAIISLLHMDYIVTALIYVAELGLVLPNLVCRARHRCFNSDNHNLLPIHMNKINGLAKVSID